MIATTSLLSLVILLVSTPTSVSAHGVVAIVSVDGKAYKQNLPGTPSPFASATRLITTVEPVKGAANADTLCGPARNHNTQFAAQTLEVNPGAKMEFDWRGGDMSFWPHDTGPMLTYMASCGDGGCENFDATQARWFKIQQVARKQSGDRAWAQVDLMSGATAAVTIPENIAPGNYLIRHEIIALHLATQRGGAEFYPSCTQIRITGNGSGKPTNSEMVKFPGAYSDDDPGIFFPGTFDPDARYVYPGPQIAAFVTSPASSNNTDDDSPVSTSASSTSFNPNASPSSTPSTSAGTSTNPDSSSSGYHSQCHLKRRSPSQNDSATRLSARSSPPDNSGPMRISRIMVQHLRNLGLGVGVNFNANGRNTKRRH
ncbi:hypothetical protein BDN71DRAFT_1388451 [Pleurotus eryngii]|uniref:lytic cellulose monooxygenase (C4-dehydrogenating) n=1 Tax=Pleurotus eryngii TaxID=5323 RepID=A0A9P6DA43_PLEER|nr:hypothetical protein BDN71DRAFT_1388451 [Pleurotus eryngii]